MKSIEIYTSIEELKSDRKKSSKPSMATISKREKYLVELKSQISIISNQT